MTSRVTAVSIKTSKGKKKVACLTAYDFQTATLLDEAGIDLILVGDSLGNIVFGRDSTLAVTMEEMLHHTKAVSPACRHAMCVADMPFMSYQVSDEEAAKNAGRLVAEGGAHAVKLEGGADMLSRIKAVLKCGIPVLGHIGFTPQALHAFGGYKTTGKTEHDRTALLRDADALASAGVFAIVLECVEPSLAEEITKSVPVPTIGIGSGNNVDGQILVVNDLIGLNVGHVPGFVKREADVASIIKEAATKFSSRVKEE